ncbi:MAG: 50S ribosomal protein L33 [Patescibacteria group bacterium]
MPKRTKRPYITLQCSECKSTNYYIQKTKGKSVEIENLKPNKFCKKCRKHTEHKAKVK